jgi:hypothetical protein
MVIELLAATYYVHTTVQNALSMKIRVLSAMMAITPALIKTAHQSVYPDVEHARQEPRVHHAWRDTTILVINVIVHVHLTVSRVRRLMIVDRVRMVFIKVTRTTTLITLC